MEQTEQTEQTENTDNNVSVNNTESFAFSTDINLSLIHI